MIICACLSGELPCTKIAFFVESPLRGVFICRHFYDFLDNILRLVAFPFGHVVKENDADPCKGSQRVNVKSALNLMRASFDDLLEERYEFIAGLVVWVLFL